jgi:hypothetical protein
LGFATQIIETTVKGGRKVERVVTVLLLLVGSAGTDWLRAQSAGGPASEILHRLQEASISRRVLIRCGTEWRDAEAARVIARELVALGVAALPEIERALESYYDEGDSSEVASSAGWIALAYGQIRGASAAPKLKLLIENPRTARTRAKLCDAMARALGLSFYFEPKSEPPAITCRAPEPRDALIFLLFAFQTHDASRLGENLVPELGLTSEALATVAWADDGGQKFNAVGFRLEIEGEWVRPEGLDEFRPPKLPRIADVAAKFSDARGKPCGEARLDLRARSLGERYLVNNENIAEIFSIISKCATVPKVGQ